MLLLRSSLGVASATEDSAVHDAIMQADSPYANPADCRGPTGDLARTSEDVLNCLPRISTVGAQRLLAHFGSLAALFSASEAELRQVVGIGAIRGAALARLFTGPDSTA